LVLNADSIPAANPAKRETMAPQTLYLCTVVDLLRARLEEIGQTSHRSDMLLFMGQRRTLIEELTRLWDALEDREGLPHPSMVLTYLSGVNLLT
jgi:hypothetical protein